MPTQEEINAANVELQIANDNYAALANKYNNYMAAFKGYADASPETKAKLQGTMERALADFDQLKLNMYAAEDRIAQAQNRVNSYADIQPVVVTPTWGQRRRQIVIPEPEVVTPEPVVIPQEVAETQGRLPQNWVVQMESSYTPSWINSRAQYPNTTMTAANSRFPTPQTAAERRGTWDSRWNTYTPASSRTHIWPYTSDVVPVEIQNVRKLRWNDYLKWMQDLEKYWWYTVVGQNAYKNWYKWNLN